MTKPVKVGVVPQKFIPSLDPYKWLQQFEVAALSNAWTPEIKVQQMPSYLTGSSSLWYLNWRKDRTEKHTTIPNQTNPEPDVTWTELTTALQQAFKTVANVDIAESKLQDRKMTIGESVEDYIYSFVDLCNDFDPKMSESLKVKKIIRGLLPNYLKKIAPQIINTVDELLFAARKVADTYYLVERREAVMAIQAETELKEGKDKDDTQIAEITKLFKEQTVLFNKVMEEQKNFLKKKDGTQNFRENGNRRFNQQIGNSQGLRGQNNWNSQERRPQNNQMVVQYCTRCGYNNHTWRNCTRQVFCTNHNSYNHATRVCQSGNAQARSPNFRFGAPRSGNQNFYARNPNQYQTYRNYCPQNQGIRNSQTATPRAITQTGIQRNSPPPPLIQ
jgi:hypothetical protein